MNFSETDIDGILRAMRFAAERHRDQRRKNKEAFPYINHPIEVAELLWTVGEVREVTVIAAGLLHDTLEDTETTREEIEQIFGKKVLSLVEEVTDDKSLPKQERRRLQIEHAPYLSVGAKQIKLADKISNLREIAIYPPKHWSGKDREEYVAWGRKVVDGLRECNGRLERYFDGLQLD